MTCESLDCTNEATTTRSDRHLCDSCALETDVIQADIDAQIAADPEHRGRWFLDVYDRARKRHGTT